MYYIQFVNILKIKKKEKREKGKIFSQRMTLEKRVCRDGGGGSR